jgi:hypothetical protein
LSDFPAILSELPTKEKPMATATQTKKWTETELEELILELVAAEAGLNPAALRTELETKGAAMPIESLELFNILVEFLKRTGLQVPKKVPPGTMRSVKRFAEFAAKNAKAP